MASVTYNNAKKYRFLGQEEEGPEEPKTCTLREKILKELVKKQMSTHISLEQQLNKQRDFVRTTAEESITASTSGLATYEDYKNLELFINVKQVLRSSGLSDAEIHLLLNEDTDNSSLEAPHAREERLKAIEDKLLKRQKQLESFKNKLEHFNGAVPLNRHEFEEECSVVPNRVEADKLTACLVRLQPHQDETIPANHPINHLKHLAEELFPSDTVSRDDILPQKRKFKKSYLEGSSVKKKGKEHSNMTFLPENPKSLWDMKEMPKLIGRNKSDVERPATSCILPKDKFVDIKCNAFAINTENKPSTGTHSKPFVLTLNSSDLIPLETIKLNRKNIDELRNLDKFKNLNPGKPSSTLYIKNLSNKTSSHDLASIMGHFESNIGPKIIYRILGGRMKGQAFVTFENEEIATNALNTCNGYMLHDKPIVIEYGKK